MGFFLAKLRGELINEAASKYLQQCSSTDPLPEILRREGGLYGIHIQSDLHSFMYRRWRTELGERERFIRGFTLEDLIANQIYPSDFNKDNTDSELEFLKHKMLYSYPFNKEFIKYIHEKTRKNYHTKALVDYIYDKIKPTYREVGYTREKVQEIDNEALQGWLSKISERLDEEDVSPFTYDTDVSALFEINEHNDRFLSKAGVRLLLWDLGILELSRIPESE